MFASSLYSVDDLAAILRAIALTAAVSSDGAPSPHAVAYRRGFAAALAAVATATHIEVRELQLPTRCLEVRRV